MTDTNLKEKIAKEANFDVKNLFKAYGQTLNLLEQTMLELSNTRAKKRFWKMKVKAILRS